MTTTTKTEERASTAKQIARSSQEETKSIDDIAICYKVLTGLDPDDIVVENGTSLHGHPELQRMRVNKTTYKLINHAVHLGCLIDDYKEQVICEDAERVVAYVNGELNFCPDRAELMRMLDQYGIVLKKCPCDAWAEMTFGGPGFEKFFDSDQLGSRINSHLRRIERDANKLERVAKIQIMGFSGSPYVFLLWTDTNNVRYICYARKDWGDVHPVDYAA